MNDEYRGKKLNEKNQRNCKLALILKEIFENKVN